MPLDSKILSSNIFGIYIIFQELKHNKNLINISAKSSFVLFFRASMLDFGYPLVFAFGLT
jgi:hypothetical protein